MTQYTLFSQPIWSVSKLTIYLHDLFDSDPILQDIWVQGEVSNLSRPASGHLYFTLKDSSSALRCVMWRNTAQRLDFAPTDGQAIEAHGAISIYDIGGQYQLYVDKIRPIGEGVLFQEFLELKHRLELEGLFDTQRKRPIPHFPKRIGIVTSPTGAALRDMIDTLTRRYPLVEVVLAPTIVQGAEAPKSIISSIESLNHLVHPDIILVARGGGSIEDLWAFNEEGVARAIAASKSPVITGIGHETDFTISDFVSDLRAPTPTAAAELATPDRIEIRIILQDISKRLESATQSRISTLHRKLEHLSSRLTFRSPQLRIRADRQYLDDLEHRIQISISNILQMHRVILNGSARNLQSLDPHAILGRGYASVAHLDGQQIRSVNQVAKGDEIDVRLRDGHFQTQVVDFPVIEEE